MAATVRKSAFSQMLKDKEGNYNLREIVTLVFVVVTLVSWIAQQFFGVEVPEFMFYSFVSLVGAGCFGYSIERGISFTTTSKRKLIRYENED